MTAATERKQQNLLAKDMEKGWLYLAPPKTAAELAEWMRRRNRYRIAIRQWALRRAREDRFGFHATREALKMARLLGLTRAEEERVKSRIPTGPSASGWTRGATRGRAG
jgi:hypothetical protein